jgi:ABC-type transport system involved in cytochrome c biogenesis permease subunit
MLFFSIMIAFLGALMRASITGWAPVTNMYETVVMMALAAAIFGMWYSLYPLLHPALQQAWNYSKFPRLSALLEWFVALKAHKAAVASTTETVGEAAMREAATEFGVPGGGFATLGDRGYKPPPDTAELEAQQRLHKAQRKMTWQYLLALPRLILTLVTFYAIVLLANGDYLAQHGFVAAASNLFVTNDTVDTLTVAISVLLMIWIVPHVLLTLLMTFALLLRPSWIAAELGIQSFEAMFVVESAPRSDGKPQTTGRSQSELSGVFHGEKKHELQDTSGKAWLKQARNAALDRKLFIAITSGIVFVIALIAMLNRTEFNPDFRPIAAVLRSNFWFAVHVFPIIASYAAAFIAWGLAVVSLGFVVFGRYRRSEPDGEGQRTQILLPEPCQMFSPVIEVLIKIALLLLIVGTVLGARWADYSWGRFWSWDPKEVWALITIIFFAIVLHGKAARYYGAIGMTVGALFASIAVIITWYGINFVFKGSVHAYGGGAESNATLFLGMFIAANLLWGTLALLRYNAELYGNEAVDS